MVGFPSVSYVNFGRGALVLLLDLAATSPLLSFVISLPSNVSSSASLASLVS